MSRGAPAARILEVVPAARRLSVLLALGLAFAAAGSVGPASASAATSPCGRTPTPKTWSHVIVIAFENQSYASVLGAGAPASEFTRLAGECGVATKFTAVHFPHSLPEYMAATSGRLPFTGDCLPGKNCHSTSANIFSQLGDTGWRAFGESMPSACAKTNSGDYVTRHLPPLYYTRISQAACTANVLPLPATFGGLRRPFAWIAPDRVDDMEIGTNAQASAWLSNFLEGPAGILTHAPYTQGHTAVFIWFDTGADTDSVSTPLPFIVISPSTPHVRASAALNDYSALRVWERMLGVPCLAAACTAPAMGKTFHL
jgi:phosphatidylinositol-3-phosphatase